MQRGFDNITLRDQPWRQPYDVGPILFPDGEAATNNEKIGVHSTRIRKDTGMRKKLASSQKPGIKSAQGHNEYGTTTHLAL